MSANIHLTVKTLSYRWSRSLGEIFARTYLAKKVPCVGILFHFLKSCTLNFKQEAVSKQLKDISKQSTMCWNIVL